MNENKGKAIITEEKTKEVKPVKKDEGLRKNLLKIVLVAAIIIIVLIVIIFIVSLFGGRNLSYDQIETRMKNAAIEYYKVQDVLLPTNNGEKSEVDAATLSSEEYELMKPLSELKSDVSCTGKVVVEKINDEFVYTPYLDCGDSYATKELYKAVLEDKIVTSDDGLYEMNGEYVFRGEKPENYVKLSTGLFRIVKVTNDNKILLIPEFESYPMVYWDDRYNEEKKYNSGLNNFRVSRIYDALTALYDNGNEEIELLADTDKEKLSTFTLCIGKRSETEANNTNEVECLDQLENQMLGLLTVSDYINASLDNNCKTTLDRTCQNYNYLRNNGFDYWLATANSNSTSEVYFVNRNGYVQKTNASGAKRLRPIFLLNNNVMIKSGTGKLNDPYILK